MNAKNETILAHLNKVKTSVKGWIACCPAHEDSNPSLSINEGNDGKVLLKCHRGCEVEAIVEALGLTTSDLFSEPMRANAIALDRPNTSHQQKSRTTESAFASYEAAIKSIRSQLGDPTCQWAYMSHDSDIVGYVLRFDPIDPKTNDAKKNYLPLSLYPEGWKFKAMPKPRPLYRLPEIAQAKRVIVVEGEKCAEAARSLGFVATTSVGGSQAAAQSDWKPLAGKEVWILPDNDDSGQKYANSVTKILLKLDPSMITKIIDLPDLPDAGDIVDWIDAQGDKAKPEEMRAKLEALANDAEPSPTDEIYDLTFRPFPLDALPKPIRLFVETGAESIGCDTSYLALPLLTEIAASIGNTRRLEIKPGWLVPPILWSVIVGESGTSKTPAFKLVMKPVYERQRIAWERYKEELTLHETKMASWEKEMVDWKRDKNGFNDPPSKPVPPVMQRYVVSDTTNEALAPILMANPRGVLLCRDELSGWFGSFDRYSGKGNSSSDSANWLSMFNAETVFNDRKTGNPPTIYIPHAAVCVTGGIQPAILQQAIGQEHRESGLLARLLLACPPRLPKKWTDVEIDPNLEAELNCLFLRLFELEHTSVDGGAPKAVVVRLNEEAKAVWKNYFNAHAVEQVDLTGDLAAAWSKFEEYAARLALVVHFVRWADDDVCDAQILDEASMKAGITLVSWFKHEARRVYSQFCETDTERDQRKLIEWISRRHGKVTARDVQIGCRWLKDSGAAEESLETLVKAGLGTWQNSPTSAKGGRPTRQFILNSPARVYETDVSRAKIAGSVDVDTVDSPQMQLDQDGRLFPEHRGLPD